MVKPRPSDGNLVAKRLTFLSSTTASRLVVGQHSLLYIHTPSRVQGVLDTYIQRSLHRVLQWLSSISRMTYFVYYTEFCPEAWYFSVVSVVCCPVEFSASGISTSPEESYGVWRVKMSVFTKPRKGRTWPGIMSKRHRKIKYGFPNSCSTDTLLYIVIQGHHEISPFL